MLNNAPGCSHNGLALTKEKTFMLACTDEHGAILELDLNGKELRRWDADDKGKSSMAESTMSSSPPMAAPMPRSSDTLSTRPPQSWVRFSISPPVPGWIEVANDLNYANGIGVSPDQRRSTSTKPSVTVS